MKVTANTANKLVQKYQADIIFLYQQQAQKHYYIEVPGQEVIKPDYDFYPMQEKIEELEAKVRTIKHAINVHNTTTELSDYPGLTVDKALIYMAQLNKRLQALDNLRSQEAKVLDEGRGYNAGKQQVQYRVANYDVAEAMTEWNNIRDQLQALQMAIDLSNNTDVFNVNV